MADNKLKIYFNHKSLLILKAYNQSNSIVISINRHCRLLQIFLKTIKIKKAYTTKSLEQ